MNEEMNKALVYFGREDLTDGLYKNDIDDNVQVFLTIRQMIKLYNLQSKIDKAIEYIINHSEEYKPHFRKINLDTNQCNELLNILLEEDK